MFPRYFFRRERERERKTVPERLLESEKHESVQNI